MPITGKFNVTALLEEKAVDEKPLIYANKIVCELTLVFFYYILIIF